MRAAVVAAVSRTFSPPRTREHGYKQASPNQSHTAALPHPTYTLEMTNFSAVDDVVEAFDTAADSQVSGKVVVAL
ncbi:hypothetical protein CIP107566_00205 [Corynebacterium diphtheriae]|nr:hypothetical protein CIP107566_00205 [Corynebacterium diphtheriae]